MKKGIESLIDYTEIFKHSSEGLLVCDKTALIETANPRLCSMFGYQMQELVGEPIEILIPHKVRQKHEKLRNGFLASPAIRPMGQGRTLMGLHKDGHSIPIEISLSYYGDNESRKIIAFISDVSERVEIEKRVRDLNNELEQKLETRTAEIRNQNQLLLSIAKNFPGGNIYVLNEDMNIVLAEGTLLRKKGIKQGDLEGHSFIDRVLPDIREDVKQGLDNVLDGNTQEIELHSGNQVFSLFMVALKQDGHPNISRILVVELDITTIKKHEAEMEEALMKERELNRLKSNFVSMVSHEFRTPLSTILSSAQLINKYVNTETQQIRLKHTDKIQSSVSHLNKMIEEILSLSKLEEGKISVQLEKVNLQEICSEIVADIQSTHPARKIHAELKQIELNSDRNLLKHILMNLIDNACKYGTEGGNVEVKISSPSNGMVEISITDDGIGIPEEDQKNLFNRFYRASNAVNIKGTGLGLNIVKKYLDLIDGSIQFESELNKGTTFKINLPV